MDSMMAVQNLVPNLKAEAKAKQNKIQAEQNQLVLGRRSVRGLKAE